LHAADGIGGEVLSDVVCWNGMWFASTQATSQALQPMHVVTSMYLQTSSCRCTPAPGVLPEWPEICLIWSVPLGMAQAFSILTRNPLNSGVYALGSIAVGDSRFTDVSAVRPASSAMPR